VARHDRPPADVEISKTSEGGIEKTVLIRTSNKNVVQDTREFFVLVDGQPYMLPCAGTRHTFARTWQSHFQQLRHPTTGKVLPSFLYRYRLTTVPTQNAKGRWFGVRFEHLGPVDTATYDAGKQLAAIVERGAMRIETPIGDNG
jgi:hypothetical protein